MPQLRPPPPPALPLRCFPPAQLNNVSISTEMAMFAFLSPLPLASALRIPFQSENRVQKKAVAMVIHPLALPRTFLATRCTGGFSSPVTFCNFHSNYITLACACVPPHGVKRRSVAGRGLAPLLSPLPSRHIMRRDRIISTFKGRGGSGGRGGFARACVLPGKPLEQKVRRGGRNGELAYVT